MSSNLIKLENKERGKKYKISSKHNIKGKKKSKCISVYTVNNCDWPWLPLKDQGCQIMLNTHHTLPELSVYDLHLKQNYLF